MPTLLLLLVLLHTESFYAPSFKRLWGHWTKNDRQAAFVEQMWKFNVSGVFGQYGGAAAERTVYKVPTRTRQ